MTIKRFIMAGVVAGGVVLPSAAAACTLTLNNGGALALSMDGATLGSEQPLGTSAALLITSVLSATVQIGAPTLAEVPNDYDDSADIVEIKYLGTGGLNTVSQDYTDQTTSFNVVALPLSALTINARVTNPNAFSAGQYRLRTVITCY